MSPEEHDKRRLEEGTLEYQAMKVLYPFSNPQGVERQILEQNIAAALREAVSQAYEEAARAVCRYCRLGLPVVAVTGSATNDLVPLGETYYLHRADGAFLHGDMRCESHNIRVLKEPLRFGRSAIERLLPLQDELNRAGMLK